MTFKKIVVPVLLLLCQMILAQNDSVYQLEEVVITDHQLKEFSNSQSVQQLSDSTIRRNQPSLSSLLQYNSTIYFKENGRGMVSSASFRGTTAQQTAVLWNGININSVFNGQTDFNTINARDFSTVAVRAGGGSVIYGSSAIGGSIHLNNELSFTPQFTNEVKLDYGSFNTLGASYRMVAAYRKFSLNINLNRNSSDNDYEYPGYEVKNENGQYYNTSFNGVFGYRLNDRNTLKLYSYLYDDSRNFSGTIAAPSRSKYKNFNARNMLEWVGTYGKFKSTLKAAELTEDYKYYDNAQLEMHTAGKVHTYIGRYDLSYQATGKILVNGILDYTENHGRGTDINPAIRNTWSGSLLMKHQLTEKIGYEAGVRTEKNNVYNSPFLFSFGAKYNLTKFYILKLNASRNYRTPTFNDLYWRGSGNPNLQPETSYQAELGNEIRVGGVTLTITGYYINLTNMLQWTPGVSLWTPQNLRKANTYGVESIVNWEKEVGQSKFSVNGTYAYTRSNEIDDPNQLIYVPYHKATASVAYNYKIISAYYRHLFNGEVFTTSDNSSKLDAYNVSDIGGEVKLLKGFTIGFQVLNVWDAAYQNVTLRPLPGRNYNTYINFKF